MHKDPTTEQAVSQVLQVLQTHLESYVPQVESSFGFRLLQQAMKDQQAHRIMLCLALDNESWDAFEHFAAAELDREANQEG